MNVLVYFSFVEDMDRLTDSEWHALLEEDNTYPIKHRVSMCGESGLEQALRLKQSAEREIHLQAVTMISKESNELELFAQKVQALQFKLAFLINSEDNCFTDVYKAEYLRDFVEKQSLSYQAYIFEYEDERTGFSLIPAYLSEFWQIPLIENVNEIVCLEETVAEVIVNKSDGTDTLRVALPAIFSIGASSVSKLRMPSMKDKLKTRNQQPERIVFNNQSKEAGPVPSLKKLEKDSFSERDCRLLVDEEDQRMADELLSLLRGEGT